MRKGYKKDIKQKSFFFEDYTESEFLVTKTKNKFINISLNRSSFLFFIFFSIAIIFSVKIVYLSTYSEKSFILKKNYQSFTKKRGDIIDRNGIILARNIDIYSAAVKPLKVKDIKNFLINLKIIFPEINLSDVNKKLSKKKFFYIKKRLTEEERTKLWLLGSKAIIFEKRVIRIYPQKNLLSHILGQIDDNNVGISGVEEFFDNDLKKDELIKSSLILSIDSNLQHIIREELIKAKVHFQTTGSGALLMNANSGEILSLISLPDYDLNKRFSIDKAIYTNKITKGVYELGSVFKTFTLAAGFENNIIEKDTIFKNLESKIFCAGRSISEHDKLPKDLTAEQILIRSSNIGAIRIAQRLGIEKYKNFLNTLEIFNKINFDLKEIGTPLNFKWGKCKLATASFGHGITTTPLLLSKAYATLGNGGYQIQPTILKKRKEGLSRRKKIISTETSKKINSILRKVVANKEGTANFADINGYEVGGKTGTALKSQNGIYTNKKINTFISLFPISKPEYVLLVILDEPKAAPEYVYEFPNGYKHKGEKRNTSGWNTVVVAGKIIEKIGPILAINNLQASNKF